MPNEPSMEEILSSIRRIIADEDSGQGDRAATPRAPRRGSAPTDGPRVTNLTFEQGGADDRSGSIADDAENPAQDAILELTDALPDEPASLEEPMREPTRAAPKVEPKAGETRTPRSEPRTESRSERRAPTKDSIATRDANPGKSDAARAAQARAVLSDSSAQAARDSLDHLTKLLVRNEDGQSNTLEGLVRELLRPMLKDWLDAHLPELVESLVKREIDRISGRV